MPKTLAPTGKVGFPTAENLHPSPALGLKTGALAHAVNVGRTTRQVLSVPLGLTAGNVVAPANTPPAVAIIHSQANKVTRF